MRQFGPGRFDVDQKGRGSEDFDIGSECQRRFASEFHRNRWHLRQW